MRRSPKLLLGMLLAAAVLFGAYQERWRPQFHFSPRANWTNDPCGLVFAFGKYNLFFQYNPFAIVWGHMSWGHAASKDLVHWNELPVAIRDDERAAIFTGSSVFDARDTSGLCGNAGCIMSIYTGYSPKSASHPEMQTQNLAYSRDGLTWTKFSGNPVLDLHRGDTRDPKVFWHEATHRWIMVIVQADDKKIRLFASGNLKDWRQVSEFGPQGATGGAWECPDLYPLDAPGSGSQKWILKIGLNPGHIAGGSGEQYFVGNFDGTRFTPDQPNGPIRWLDYGRDSYCALTFNNDPSPKSPHLIGWMNNWQYAAQTPTSPWRGQMTLPRTLSLGGEEGSFQVLQQPAPELRELRTEALTYSGADVSNLNERLASWPHKSQTFEMELSAKLNSGPFEVELLKSGAHTTVIGFDPDKQQLYVDRTHSGNTGFSAAFPSRTVAPMSLASGELKLHVFVDRCSVEVFAQNGSVVMTNLVFPDSSDTGLSVAARGAKQIDLKLWKLKGIWPL